MLIQRAELHAVKQSPLITYISQLTNTHLQKRKNEAVLNFDIKNNSFFIL